MKKEIIRKKLIAGFMAGALLLSGFGVLGENVKAEEPNESDQEVIQDVVEEEDEIVVAEDEESFGEIIDSGVDGGVTWSLNDEGLLDITVTGDLSYVPTSPIYQRQGYYSWPWNHKCKYCDAIKKVKVSGTGLTHAQYMFSHCVEITSFDFSDFDTSEVTDMSCMFYKCESLENVDLSAFNTGKVTSMWYMFFNCNSLKKLDLSGFDTSNVTNMSEMFGLCNSLTNLDVSSFDTKNVTDMSFMFSGCESLKKLDVSGFDTSNVTSMPSMFGFCGLLTSLDVSGFDTGNVTEMSVMFRGCSSLKKLDLSNFDMSSIKITTENKNYSLFNDCNNLELIKTPKKLPADKEYKLILPASYLNKSGKERTEILDTNDIYTRWDVPVTGVKLNKTSLKLNVGDTTALKAIILPSDASLKTLKWSISNKKVATVDRNGKVKALANGTTNITVTTVDGSKKATCKVTVSEKQVATITMYRLYNPNSGEHFYTSSQSEIDTIVAAGWKNEGVAWKAPKKSKTPVYRLYNPNAGDHHYTTSAAEKESLEKAGWKYEGIGWYSDDNKGVPLHRLYNPNATTGSHHYTTSAVEKDNLVKAGWKYEGIAWYGMK